MEGVAGVLESALYYEASDHDAVVVFYESTLGLERVAAWDSGRALRLGAGVLLLFDLDKVTAQGGPVSDHGARGPGHVCLLAEPGRYDELRERVAVAGVEVTHDHEWPKGGSSFYFKDPAGNLLEIADSDLWR